MQQLIAQSGGLFQIPSLLKEKGVQSLLLVTGKHFIAKPIYQSFIKAIDVPTKSFNSSEGLLQLSSIPQTEYADAVLAIGGGKTLDFAKGIIHYMDKPVYFIAVPTTAGSGSEATPFAVFYSGKEKVSIDNPALLPQTVVLDAVLLKNLPAKQKAISGADAFAQCIEAIWNLRHNEISKAFALDGLAFFWNDLSTFVHSTDEELTARMLLAANLSGKAISSTRTTGPHALSYYLTAYYNVPHGQAVALFLPLFFLYNDVPEVVTRIDPVLKLMGAKDAEEACAVCRRFFSSIGLATNFAEAGLQNISVDELLKSVNQQRFANNPVPFDAEKLQALIERYLL